MPVLVVGADTPIGSAVLDALVPRESEVRAFVSDDRVAGDWRARGVKVAIGDVSDASHVGGAALHVFCGVLVAQAALDDRERAFASTVPDVLAAWRDSMLQAGVKRVIWIDGVADGEPAAAEVAVVETVGRSVAEVAARVSALESAARI